MGQRSAFSNAVGLFSRQPVQGSPSVKDMEEVIGVAFAYRKQRPGFELAQVLNAKGWTCPVSRVRVQQVLVQRHFPQLAGDETFLEIALVQAPKNGALSHFTERKHGKLRLKPNCYRFMDGSMLVLVGTRWLGQSDDGMVSHG